MSIPDTAPPTTTEFTVLHHGDGPTITDGDEITVQFQAVHWESGKVFAEKWDDGSETFSTTGGVAGVRDAIIGQTVGSQLLVVLPPVEGAEPHALPSAGIESEDTFVYVFGIIGIKP